MTVRTRVMIVLAAALAIGEAEAVTAVPGAVEHGDRPGREPQTTIGGAAALPRRTAEPQPSGNPLWAVPLRELSASRSRPLFAPSRRPAPPAVAAYRPPPEPPPKPVEPEKPQLTLVGTVAGGGGGGGIGVFLDPAAKNVLRLKVGEGHKGWAVRAVQKGEVVLEKGRQNAVLKLPPPELKRLGGAFAPLIPLSTPPAAMMVNAPPSQLGAAPPSQPGSAPPGGAVGGPPPPSTFSRPFPSVPAASGDGTFERIWSQAGERLQGSGAPHLTR